MIERKSGRLYARQILNGSGIAKNISEEEIDKLIDRALRYGEDRAQEMRERYGNDATVYDIAEAESLTISYEEGFSGGQDFVKFGEISIKEKRISLDVKALSRLDENELDGIDPREVIICHELYHYLEERYWHRFYDGIDIRRKVLCFHVRIPLWPLGEIAANAFAKAFLSLPFEPGFLDELYFAST